MLRNRALVRSACLAAMVAAASLSLVTSVSAATGPVAAVALVGAGAPQVGAGAVLGTTAERVAVVAPAIPQIERTDGSGRTSYAFTDTTDAAAGDPVAPSAPADLALDTSTLVAASILPAAEVPDAAGTSLLSTVLLLVGLLLFTTGVVTVAPSGWRRLVIRVRTATAFQHRGTNVLIGG